MKNGDFNGDLMGFRWELDGIDMDIPSGKLTVWPWKSHIFSGN